MQTGVSAEAVHDLFSHIHRYSCFLIELLCRHTLTVNVANPVFYTRKICRSTQPAKARSSMCVVLPGMIIFLRFLHFMILCMY